MLDNSHIYLAKLDLLLEECKNQSMNILGLCETRGSKECLFKCDELTIVFSGSEKDGPKGVAIILDKCHASCLKSFNSISERILMLKLNTKPVPVIFAILAS